MRDGSLFGAAGDSEGCMILLDGLKKGIQLPSVPKHDKGPDIHALLITKDASIFMYEGFRWSSVPQNYIAIGSGRKAALALLHYGATAIEAVRGGIRTDPYTGGRILTVRLGRRK